MEARRHQIVARALRRAGGQDRRLEFAEALVDHAPPDRGDDVRAQGDVALHLLAPQVEIAVAEADFFAIVGVAVDLERQWRGGGFDAGLGDFHFDMAGRQVRVDRIVGAFDDRPGHGQHALQPHRVHRREGRIAGFGDALGQTVAVAQVEEQQVAVIALAMDPAGQADRLPGVVGAQRAAGMRAEGMHRKRPKSSTLLGIFQGFSGKLCGRTRSGQVTAGENLSSAAIRAVWYTARRILRGPKEGKRQWPTWARPTENP